MAYTFAKTNFIWTDCIMTIRMLIKLRRQSTNILEYVWCAEKG